MTLRPFRTLLLATFALALSAAALRASPREDNPGCDTDLSEQVDAYRENYVPREFYPEPPRLSYIDDAVLAAFLVLGALFAMGKIKPTRKRGLAVSAAAFIYFGLLRGGCVCPVGALANVCLGLRAPELIGVAVAILFLLPLFASLVAGRVFCSFGCPLGAVQDLARKKRFLRLPRWTLYIALLTTSAALVLTVFAILSEERHFMICALDPYKVLFHTGYATVSKEMAVMRGYAVEHGFIIAGTLTAWLALLAVLILGFWIPRPFCRFVCPYGLLLGVISTVAFKRRSIDADACVHCGACQKRCPTNAIKIDRENKVAKLSNLHCVQCGECSAVCPKDAVK